MPFCYQKPQSGWGWGTELLTHTYFQFGNRFLSQDLGVDAEECCSERMAKLSFFKLGSPRNLFGQVFRDIPSR